MVASEAGEDVEEAVSSEEDEDSGADQPSLEFVDLHIPTYIATTYPLLSCTPLHHFLVPVCVPSDFPNGQLRVEALILPRAAGASK